MPPKSEEGIQVEGIV